MSDETYFQQDWLTIPQFKDWLSAGKESTKAYCKRCSKTMNYQIWEYKQLRVMLQINLLYSFHALCCKIKM